MKTINDLKRKLQKGQGLKLVGGFYINPDSKILNIVRYVVKTQTNGVYLNSDKESLKGSWLDFPKASLCEIDEKGFKIFEPKLRDLTEEEKDIKAKEPTDKQQEYIDAISDGSQMFYAKQRYYKEKGFEYLFGCKSSQGKYLTNRNGKEQIRDDSLKGEVSLIYEFVD